jgi:hypothetical protein
MHKQTVNKCTVLVPNQTGALKKVTQILTKEGVNIDSVLTETYGDVAAFRFLLEKENGTRKRLQTEGFQVIEDQVFRLDLPNRPGELNKLTAKLADEEIGIRYLYGTSHGQTTKVILAVDRPEKAAAIVKEFDETFAASAN